MLTPTTQLWQKPEVAKAQLDLVAKQLVNPYTVAPFRAFVKAMEVLQPRGGSTLLDVGCGVGHYGVLCSRSFPQINYHGVDYSQAMIEQARYACPQGQFTVREFKDQDFANFDIVLVGQVLEYLENPWDGLQRILEQATGAVILHRLRITEQPSYRTAPEEAYCGNQAPNYCWNLQELVNTIKRAGKYILHSDVWDNNLTLVFRGAA